MLIRYIEKLREARCQARKMRAPHVARIIASAGGCIFVYVLLAIALHPSDRALDYHFRSERGLVTAASVVLLAAASAFALSALAVLVRSSAVPIWPWALLAAGLAFLEIDEVAGIHKRLSRVIEMSIAPTGLRSWSDAIVIFYGLLAIPIMLAILSSLMRFPWVLELFAAAFMFYAIHTLVDSTQEPPTELSVIVEESAKLFTGACLATGTFAGFWSALCSFGDRRPNN